MLKPELRREIIDLIKCEVVPAIGCTEPVAVALCACRAKELLGEIPDKIEVELSANILKNAMGVGIPGTGMIGLPIAIALGVLIGHSEYNLEVLKEVEAEDVQRGKQMISDGKIDISLKKDISECLYIEVTCRKGENNSKAIIAGGHTRFVYLAQNGNPLLDLRHTDCTESDEQSLKLNMQMVYDFATTTPLDELRFILKSRDLNKAAAQEAIKHCYGHELGRTLQCSMEKKIIGDSIFAHILSYTSAACDARMGGAVIPVMSNSGSGNQGIAATMPVVIFAEENDKSEEELIRALTLSHLTVIYIKESLGRLSALCGCVVAATGSSCGLTYLMGGDYRQITFAVKNMVANLTGMICDGAKPSCAMKVTSGVSTAVFSAIMAMQKKCVTSLEGIVDDDVDRTIGNLTRIGTQGMCQTDNLILDIMTHKVH